MKVAPTTLPIVASSVSAPQLAVARSQVTPLSKSVQPTIASATVNSLSSPQFGQFASYCVPENRGVGSSILPLTTSTNSAFSVDVRIGPHWRRHPDPSNRRCLQRPPVLPVVDSSLSSRESTRFRIAMSHSEVARPRRDTT